MKYGEHNLGPLEERFLKALVTPKTVMEARETVSQALRRPIDRTLAYQVIKRLAAKRYLASNDLKPRNYWITQLGQDALESTR